MTKTLIDAVRKFQEFLLEAGVSRSVLALPAPRMLALPAPESGDSGVANVFTLTITESEIVTVARDLFASGHYSFAVQEAYKALDKFVSERAGPLKVGGTAMMDQVFSPSDPVLFWTQRLTISEIDEQKGYHRLFTGAMLGIRNPVTHEFNWVQEPDVALELLIFAQHLLRKAKNADIKHS